MNLQKRPSPKGPNFVVLILAFCFFSTAAYGLTLGLHLGLGGQVGGAIAQISRALLTGGGDHLVDDNRTPVVYKETLTPPSAPLSPEGTGQAGAIALNWFPPSAAGSSPVRDYEITYKLSSDSAYGLFNDGISTDTAATVDGLTPGSEYNFKITAISAVGYGPASAVVTATAAGEEEGLEEIIDGVVACWSAKDYSGTGDWLNDVAAPADGSAQSAYDLTPSGSAIWDGTLWTFDGTNTLDVGTNTTFLNGLHKSSAGNDWSAIALVRTAESTEQMSLFGTADVTADHGAVWRVDSSNNHKLDQYNGSGTVTQNGTNTIVQDTRYTMVVAVDVDSNTVKFSRNQSPYVTKSANWLADTTNASYSLKVGSEGNGGSKIDGWSLYAMCLIDHDLSEPDALLAQSWLESEYPTAAAVAPGQVYSVMTMPTNGGIHLAWDGLPADAEHDKTGGSAITDYTIQYKLSSSGTWLTFADGTSTDTYDTVTGIVNGSAYDFRIAATNTIGTGSWSDTVSDTPQAKGTNPYDLSDWKITFPVDENTQLRQGTNALEIEPPEIVNYSNAWFGQIGDILRFNCTYPAATTSSNAVYGRSELRGLFDGKEFAATEDNPDEVEFHVTECPTSSGTTKTYVQQIHDDGPPLYKIGYDCRAGTGQDRLRLLMKTTDTTTEDDVSVTLKTNITRGQWTNSYVVYDGDGSEHGGQQTVDFYIDGVLKHSQAINKTGANGLQYNKRGNYCQLGPAGSKTVVEHRAPTFVH